MYQAQKDAKYGQLPAVFHRKNRSEWLVTMKLEDWITLYNEYYSSKKLEECNDYESIVEKEIKEVNQKK